MVVLGALSVTWTSANRHRMLVYGMPAVATNKEELEELRYAGRKGNFFHNFHVLAVRFLACLGSAIACRADPCTARRDPVQWFTLTHPGRPCCYVVAIWGSPQNLWAWCGATLPR